MFVEGGRRIDDRLLSFCVGFLQGLHEVCNFRSKCRLAFFQAFRSPTLWWILQNQNVCYWCVSFFLGKHQSPTNVFVRSSISVSIPCWGEVPEEERNNCFVDVLMVLMSSPELGLMPHSHFLSPSCQGQFLLVSNNGTDNVWLPYTQCNFFLLLCHYLKNMQLSNRKCTTIGKKIPCHT